MSAALAEGGNEVTGHSRINLDGSPAASNGIVRVVQMPGLQASLALAILASAIEFLAKQWGLLGIEHLNLAFTANALAVAGSASQHTRYTDELPKDRKLVINQSPGLQSDPAALGIARDHYLEQAKLNLFPPLAMLSMMFAKAPWQGTVVYAFMPAVIALYPQAILWLRSSHKLATGEWSVRAFSLRSATNEPSPV